MPGVVKATVSYKDKAAIVLVTYDDGRADVKSLTDATTNAGHPLRTEKLKHHDP